ncbi:hypothetical protein Mal4_25210 [Maioricimonas rarisocia]|uniref:Glycosyltransferase RgtA/B/C/D-like domain-containing protein n=1 Tax=Maioricimonas rarisocia TaxID=2528026 RepID=A0A517Z6S7_9PLAN|nr:hypothetical protein [Maioricimonas rarisocia]QDU38196.1 hypothetical protein Mal4_25210 [Maioricimonas rarisocia]
MVNLLLVVSLLLTLVGASLLWLTDLPLGVPGEWTWDRIAYEVFPLGGWFLAAVAGAAYLGFVRFGASRIESTSRLKQAGWLTLLVAAGWCWIWGIQSTIPGIHGTSKQPFVIYYPRFSGYFWQARYEVSDTAEFLRDYEELLAEQDYLHIGTHPPGLTLGYRLLHGLCESVPALTAAANATIPPRIEESLAILNQSAVASGHPLTPADTATLWLATVLTLLAAAGCVVPLFALLRRWLPPRDAWKWSALWPLVPALAIFSPKSDLLYPLFALSAAWLWLTGWERGSFVRPFVGGFVAVAGMTLSLAVLPACAILGVETVLLSVRDIREGKRSDVIRQWIRAGLAVIAGVLLPIILFAALADVNLIRVWLWNLSNHALFYDHNVRTYAAWLAVNPLEMAFAVGLPLTTLAVAGLVRSVHRPLASTAHIAAISGAGMWGLLWLSGKNMGEAARLWIVLMPWVLIAAASWTATGNDSENADRTWHHDRLWWGIAILQVVAAIATVTRVDGFHFAEMLGP